jgi:hypothetical protein
MRGKDISSRVFKRILGYQVGDLVKLKHSMPFYFYQGGKGGRDMSFRKGKEGTIVLMYESCFFQETVFLISFGIEGVKRPSVFKLGKQDFE